ncbi:MAG: hypothetical protein J5851_00170, partial [Oscillospiraceae bacterium]|nr:hypothetical protein [Oscillospiraceae bacterium]
MRNSNRHGGNQNRRYTYEIHYDDGAIYSGLEEAGESFETEEAAIDSALYCESCSQLGAEMFHESNPGDQIQQQIETIVRFMDDSGFDYSS